MCRVVAYRGIVTLSPVRSYKFVCLAQHCCTTPGVFWYFFIFCPVDAFRYLFWIVLVPFPLPFLLFNCSIPYKINEWTCKTIERAQIKWNKIVPFSSYHGWGFFFFFFFFSFVRIPTKHLLLLIGHELDQNHSQRVHKR